MAHTDGNRIRRGALGGGDVVSKIWFDMLKADQRVLVAERMIAPPQPMVKMGAHWGDGTSVQCAGDEAHMMREVSRQRQNKHSDIAHKLPIWC